jgi:hypothetical protein
VSDIFTEVDEELRREQFKKLWERYGNLVIALVVLFVAAVGGWRAYEWYEAKRAAEAGAAFQAAIALSDEGKHQEAEAAFAKVAADTSGSYRVLAKMREAASLSSRDSKAAITIYQALAADRSVDQMQRDLAVMRAAYLQVDTASYDELKSQLEPLTVAGLAFRPSARALVALAAWRANNTAEMRRWSDMIMADAETPSATRSQIEMLQALDAAAAKS